MIDYKKELFSYAYKKRIPLTATIEIISQCNFRCIYCYIDDNYRKDMLTFEQVVDFGNQIVEMGCLYVTLTGGEVLLHPDFKKIYTFFAQKGVCISVFTNGSLVDKDIVDLFVKYPPRVVEITMYGFSCNTYEQVTKVAQYETVRKNILELKRSGINVLTKMFVMKENYCDFENIRLFALENSIPFKYDTMILADFDSDEFKHQLQEDIVLKLDISKSSTEVKYNEDARNYIIGTRQNKMFQCGAGRSSCWLKSNNRLRVCNFLSCIEFDLKEYRVSDAWNLISYYIDGDIPTESKCYNCKNRGYCRYCPAMSFMKYQRTDMLYCDDIYCKNAALNALADKNGGENEKNDL